MSKRQLPPDRVSSYFRAESGVLAVITVTGLLYNIGLVAGPWFEGHSIKHNIVTFQSIKCIF